MTNQRNGSSASRFCLFFFFLFTGCGAWCAQFDVPGPDDSTAPITAVEFYIDATASMQGFVRSDRITTFAYYTRTLESRLHSLWPPSQVPYTLNRFGLVAKPFDNLRDAWTPAFYAPAKGFEDTDLSVAARSVQPGQVVVILTDLFQSDSHIESFRSELLKRGLGKAFQFAVVALRAEFNGTVYDIPPSKSTQRYRGLRPAYALLIGPAPALQELLNALLERPSDLGTSLAVAMFSNRIGTPTAAFHDLPSQSAQGGYFHAPGFDPDQQLIAGGPKPFTRELRLSRSAAEPRVDFDVNIDLKPYESLPPPESFRLAHIVRMCNSEAPGIFDRLFSSSANAPKPKEQCPVAPPEFDIVYDDSSASVSRTGPKLLSVNVKLDFGRRDDPVRGVRARSSKVYIVRSTVASSARAAHMPDWISSFSEDGRRAFDGSKTPDLADFLDTMQESVTQAGPVTLFDSYLFIDSK